MNREFIISQAKFFGLVALAVFGAVGTLIRRERRVCSRCATRSQSPQWLRALTVYAAVLGCAAAISDGSAFLDMPILAGIALSMVANLLGAGQPVCPACGGRTLVPTTSPIGEELMRDYRSTSQGS